jgi:hypothetical protein
VSCFGAASVQADNNHTGRGATYYYSKAQHETSYSETTDYAAELKISTVGPLEPWLPTQAQAVPGTNRALGPIHSLQAVPGTNRALRPIHSLQAVPGTNRALGPSLSSQQAPSIKQAPERP